MNPRKLIDTMKGTCRETPERAPDYQEALLETVSDIVWAEHKHVIRATTIQKTVTEQCEALGDFIHRNTGNEGES